MRLLVLLSVLAVTTAPAFAQKDPLPVNVPVVVTNGPNNPVPVTGTVTVAGGAGATTSADKTATVFEEGIPVTDLFFANHTTSMLDVSDYKEVRLSLSHGSCGPCGGIEVAVFAGSETGSPYQIDLFTLTLPGGSGAGWGTRTYSVPGSRMLVSLRTTTAGSQNTVRVGVFGRAN